MKPMEVAGLTHHIGHALAGQLLIDIVLAAFFLLYLATFICRVCRLHLRATSAYTPQNYREQPVNTTINVYLKREPWPSSSEEEEEDVESIDSTELESESDESSSEKKDSE